MTQDAISGDFKYAKQKASFANKQSSSTPPMAQTPTPSNTKGPQRTSSATNRAPQAFKKATPQATNQSANQVKSSSITCFKCGGSGHKSFECVNNKVMIVNAEGERDSMSEGEYYALHQVALNTLDMEANDEETLYCDGDDQPSLVVTRVLTTFPQDEQDQRCNLFQTRAGINGKSIKVIIDGGSCHNLASKELCEKLKLTYKKHPNPYHVQWLSDSGTFKIQHTVNVSFKIGPYEDTVECDVVPMTVCHLLLGRPWQYDRAVLHDGRTNFYSFKWNNKSFVLRPMTPSQVIADNAKALARKQDELGNRELSGERVTHLKESECHKPNVSAIVMRECKGLALLTTKREMRELRANPSMIHFV